MKKYLYDIFIKLKSYNLIQGILKKLRNKGIDVRKAPPPSSFKAIPIFDLAVNYLIAKNNENLSFIQVGANDGDYGDPLKKYIFKYDWNGIFIEPQPEIFKELLINYKDLEERLHFENIAISNTPESISLFRPFIGKEINRSAIIESSIASTIPNVTARQFGIKESDLEEIKVPTMTLDAIVEKYQLLNIDILQIDTEGYDWGVLKTLNLKKHQPKIIQFEHGHMSPDIVEEMSCHLRDHGYLLYYGGHELDSVAIRSDFIEF